MKKSLTKHLQVGNQALVSTKWGFLFEIVQLQRKSEKAFTIFFACSSFFAGIVFFLFLVTIAIKTDASDHLSFSGNEKFGQCPASSDHYARTSACACVHACACVRAHTNACAHTSACTCLCMCACVCVCACVFVRACLQESGIDDLQRRVIRTGNGDW